MDHGNNPISRGRGWAVAAGTILVMAAVLGIASDQTSQFIGSHFRFGERSIASASQEVASVAKHAVAGYDTLPIILTVPFAVTRTQQMMVARVKHRAAFAHRVDQFRSGLKAAPGLLAGLALMGATSSSNH
jgi:hypothetical protein